MCLAIYKPSKLKIPERNLRAGFEANNDGCGICWAQDGQLHVEKGMLTWDAFLGLYQGAEEFPMLIHFRKATHGKKNEDNCHPFLFKDKDGNDLALIHNGVIPIKCAEEGYSDTWHFVKKVLEPIVSQRGVPIDDQSLSWFVRVSIGTDKIAVMNRNGGVIIFNEEKGNWDDTDGPDGLKGKVWYSNYSFRSNRHYNCSNTTYQSPTRNESSALPAVRSNVGDDGTAEWEGYGYHAERVTEGANTPLNGEIPIADDATRGPGKMCEYGWHDTEIEAEIVAAQSTNKMNREDAIIHVFNNA